MRPLAARKRPEPAGLASDSAPGAALPLLPTLLVAVAVAALSLVCREPAAPDPAPIQAASVIAEPAVSEPDISKPAPAAPAFVPASLAFSVQVPMTAPFVAEARLEAPRRHPASARIAAIRRPAPTRAAPASEQAAIVSAPVETARVEASQAESEESALPGLALPFAPTLRAMARAREFVGAQGAAAKVEAAAFGEALAGLVGGLR